MSGFVGSCIVCGAFHATGHFGDEYVDLSIRGKPVLACPSCIPFAPKHEEVVCNICGCFGVELQYPPEAYGAKHQSEWRCNLCKEVIKHKELHDRIALIDSTDKDFNTE